MKKIGTTTTDELLNLANSSTLLQSGHELYDYHYGAYPPGTEVHVWKETFQNGHSYYQSVSGRDPEFLSSSFELEFELGFWNR